MTRIADHRIPHLAALLAWHWATARECPNLAA